MSCGRWVFHPKYRNLAPADRATELQSRITIFDWAITCAKRNCGAVTVIDGKQFAAKFHAARRRFKRGLFR